MFIAFDILGGSSSPIGVHGEAGLRASIFGKATALATVNSPSLNNEVWSNGSISIFADISVGANAFVYAKGTAFLKPTPSLNLELFDTGSISIWNGNYQADIPMRRDAVCSTDEFSLY